ncbi:polymorphic toxin-type HINT domain-containing protein [Streptomyces sp. H27-D2]|uniref:polymorphic toxin-type HINT domain-containing protein n=1 Tax=Streptomyces sp. H27-D2 TaxID=3046304 RepID=UPI002DB7CBD9|nr:polymorphic toxin-type HINT domain-containing protein [Streptomyces sp. H27-D2]MEC4016557.1 polymorphic toxin-type HINT domain-containing protein [Streptomyces sp. H27-D2]
MPRAVVAARLVLFVLCGLSALDAVHLDAVHLDALRGGAVALPAYALIPAALGLALAGSLRVAGRLARWAAYGVQCWLLVEAWGNIRAGEWWGSAQFVAPLLVIVLVSLRESREWFALPGDRRARRGGFSPVRMFRLRVGDAGQTATEYVGLIAVVALIIGGLAASGIGPEISERIKTAVCEVAGGADCGGSEPVADGGGGGTTVGGADGGNGGTGQPANSAALTQEEKDYEAAKKLLERAEEELNSDKEKAKKAAIELAKIIADELGITDALDCITKGDGSACGATIINILTSLVGGAVGKLAAKYGAPWKWKKAVKLIEAIKKHGGDLASGLKGMLDKSKKVRQAREKLAALEKKLPKREKKPDADKPDAEKPDADKPDRPITCKHSFPPGTAVLLADGTRTAIEDVRLGDLVTVTDPDRGLTTVRPVAATITTEDDKDFTRLTVLANGRPATLTATDTHPFWLVGQGSWAEAGDIRPGATLRTPSGVTLPVLAVGHYTERQRTYDLSVEGIHTYYVGVGGENALVHNCDAVDKDFDTLPDGKQAGTVKLAKDAAELRKHFDKWTEGAEQLPARGDKIPEVYKLSDGTVVQWRKASKSGGETIDIFTPGKKPRKVHVDEGN